MTVCSDPLVGSRNARMQKIARQEYELTQAEKAKKQHGYLPPFRREDHEPRRAWTVLSRSYVRAAFMSFNRRPASRGRMAARAFHLIL